MPAGTGCDLAKSLGVPANDLARLRAHRAATASARAIDVGRIEDSYFLNVAGFGFDIAVHRGLLDGALALGGDLLYLYCALRQLHAYPGLSRWRSTVDGAPPGREDLLMLVVANARVFGGGFQIAPRADLADGRLDGVAFAQHGRCCAGWRSWRGSCAARTASRPR